jgi:hypothetical protein
MGVYCSDCKKFMRCQKNSDEWEEAKILHPGSLDMQVSYMRNVYHACLEKS